MAEERTGYEALKNMISAISFVFFTCRANMIRISTRNALSAVIVLFCGLNWILSQTSDVLELDILVFLMFYMTVMHCFRSREWSLLVSSFCLGFFTETLSIRFGGTHCHSSECSSFNSIFYYVPWVYVCVISALRLTGVSNAFPWMTGAIFFGFCGVYELSGPLMQWWLWPKDNGITNGNCTIWQYGALGLNPNNLMVSTHAAEALEERIFGVPLLAPYFHCAFGFGIAFAMCVLDFKWLPVSVFLGPAFGMMWDPPIRLAKIFLGASKSAAAPSFMLLSWLIPLFLGDPLQINQTFDPLLFLIPLLHHGFFVYNALFGAGVNLFPGNLKLVIIAISIISLAAHAKAAGLMSESFKIPLVCRSRLASLYAGVRGRAKLS